MPEDGLHEGAGPTVVQVVRLCRAAVGVERVRRRPEDVPDVADAPNGSPAQPNYLHDGRARSLMEAILWHGGEA
ncbi:MAG: di-heme oxidoredictase family protein, partial [Phycisphaerales bacterium JB040]